MFGPLRTGLGLLAALIAFAGPITSATAQGKPQQQPTATPLHQPGFSPLNPDPTRSHFLITHPNGQKLIVTVPTGGAPTGYVQGANGQYYPTYLPAGQKVTSSPHVTINEETHVRTETYFGKGNSRYRAFYSTQ